MFTNRIRHAFPAKQHSSAQQPSATLPPGFAPLPSQLLPGWQPQLYQQAYELAQRQVHERLLNLLRSRAGMSHGNWQN